MSEIPQNIEIERNLLGAMMTTNARGTQAAMVQVGLLPEHFYLDRHRDICQTIFTIADRQQGTPDELLVAAELKRTGAEVEANYPSELAGSTYAPGNLLIHAEHVVAEAQWRQRLSAVPVLEAAVSTRDLDKLAEAEDLLSRNLVDTGSTNTPEQLRVIAERIIAGGAGEVFPFPIAEMNNLTAGGLRRKEHHVIGGHSGHGKSMWLDQLLAYWAGGGLRVHLYMNEMSLEGRLTRLMTKATSVKYSKVALGKTNDHERQLLSDKLDDALTFGITDCTGWSASKIANHIRLNSWDVAAVDMLHLIPHEKEAELATISRKLTEASHLSNCLVVSAVHLNESRTMTAVKPRPTLGDIRGSGMIKNNADSVSFVWREQNPVNGLVEPYGEMLLSKVRNGISGVVPITMDSRDLSFYGTPALSAVA